MRKTAIAVFNHNSALCILHSALCTFNPPTNQNLKTKIGRKPADFVIYFCLFAILRQLMKP